jgi:hypothetical protein
MYNIKRRNTYRVKIIEALGGKTALSRKHHSEINQFEIMQMTKLYELWYCGL